MTSYIYDMVDTWNAGATTFTAVKMNVTDTASASGSLLMDLQVGGISRFSVSKAGYLNLGSNGGIFLYADAANNISFGKSTDYIRLGNNKLYIVCNSAGVGQVRNTGFVVANSGSFSFTNGDYDSLADAFLTRRGTANLRLGAADTSASATITVTIAAPGVVTWSGHSLSTGSPVIFTTTGALPTGITAGTTYYAIVVDANTFQLASSFTNALAGTAITTSGSQSGTHTGRRGAIAQTFGVQDTLSTSSLENIDGADLVIRGSRSIGNKPGGSIIFQVAPAGSSGTAQNALATALTIASDKSATFAAGITASSAIRAATNVEATSNVYVGADVSTVVGIIGSVYSGLRVRSNLGYTWSNSATDGLGTPDLLLLRDAANTLALRNGANAQFLRVYSTYTDASNYERGAINTGADFVELAAETAGTGDDNLDVRLTPAGTGNVRFGTHTGTADTAVSGYIEIKDAGGTIRKLAVIS